MNTRTNVSFAWIGVLLLTLFGCASRIEPRLYVLSSPLAMESVDQSASTESLRITLGRLGLPAYLDRVPMVTRRSATELEVSEFHRWAGSLSDNVRHVLAQNLSVLLGTDHVFSKQHLPVRPDDYKIDIEIVQLDGVRGGDVRLQARWVLDSADREVIAVQYFDRTVSASGESYADYALAQSDLLADLSREIANAIAEHQSM